MTLDVAVAAELPPPELPTADVFRPWRPGPAAVPGNRRLTLGRERWAALSERAAKHGGTGSEAVFTAFADVIGAWSRTRGFAIRRDDVSTSSAVAVVQSDVSAPFRVRVAQDRERADARDAGLPVAFAFGAPLGETGDSLLIGCHADTTAEEGLTVEWHVNEAALAAGIADAMFTAFEQLICGLADVDATWESPDTVPLPAGQALRRAEVNATEGPLPDGLLHDQVVAQCSRTPDAVAVVAADMTLTYAQLLRRAVAVAADLRGRPGGSGRIVAVALDKSAAQIVSVLAILLTGAAYLPLDMAQPPARRGRILRDAGARFVLAAGDDARNGEWPEDVTAVAVDEFGEVADAAEPPASTAGPDDLAYVIYTSGSTGVPKGVMISHRAALNTVEDLNRRFAVGATDRALGLSSLGFDLSVYDIFGLLAVGGALVLPDSGRRGDPAHWAELLVRHGVTVWNSVPAQMGMLADHLEAEGGADGASPPRLRLVMLSGDWIPVPLPDRIRALIPGLRVVSLGGATEAAIWSIWYDIGAVAAHWPSIPYGGPMVNQTWHVLDDLLRPRPDGVVGELYIGGAGLSMGYLGDEEKTAYRFVRHPETGERLYRTGDLGRYHPDGLIELLGRQDRQVKIRGYRVEPAEIEAILLAHPAVKDAAVVAHPDASGGLRLAAYYVGIDDDVAVADLREHAGSQLPAYMVPSTFTALPALPLTGNGKVDRAALPAPAAGSDAGAPDDGGDDAPLTEAERIMAGIWAEILEVEAVRPTDDFFLLGGHSMLATQVVAEVRELFGVRVPLRLMFEDTTLRGFAAAVAAIVAAVGGQGTGEGEV